MKKSYTANLENLETIAADVENFCEENGVGGAECFAINLCIDEIFTNIVTYGYRNDPSKYAELRLEKSADFVRITLSDNAPKFDPLKQAAAPDIDASIDERKIGGLGIFFIKKNMDDVSYAYENGVNRLTMLKKLTPPPNPSEGREI